MVQKSEKIVISGNCLQFPEIPAKFREIFTEKAAISLDFQQNFEKICKNRNSSGWQSASRAEKESDRVVPFGAF